MLDNKLKGIVLNKRIRKKIFESSLGTNFDVKNEKQESRNIEMYVLEVVHDFTYVRKVDPNNYLTQEIKSSTLRGTGHFTRLTKPLHSSKFSNPQK